VEKKAVRFLSRAHHADKKRPNTFPYVSLKERCRRAARKGGRSEEKKALRRALPPQQKKKKKTHPSPRKEKGGTAYS